MIVKYKGENCVSLTREKEYEVISVGKGWFRIVDDTAEDYLFEPERFEVVEN